MGTFTLTTNTKRGTKLAPLWYFCSLCTSLVEAWLLYVWQKKMDHFTVGHTGTQSPGAVRIWSSCAQQISYFQRVQLPLKIEADCLPGTAALVLIHFLHTVEKPWPQHFIKCILLNAYLFYAVLYITYSWPLHFICCAVHCSNCYALYAMLYVK